MDDDLGSCLPYSRRFGSGSNCISKESVKLRGKEGKNDGGNTGCGRMESYGNVIIQSGTAICHYT